MNQIDPALAAIFLSDLSRQLQDLWKSFECLHENPQEKKQAEVMLKTVQKVGQGAKITKVEPLVKIGMAIAAFLQAIKEGSAEWNGPAEACLKQFLNDLQELSAIQPLHLDEWLAAHREHLGDIQRQVEQLAKGQTALKQSQQERPKEAVVPAKEAPFALDPKMYDLFCNELETQTRIMNQGLLDLEQKPTDPKLLEMLMRAAHSLKGAARVVVLNPIVRLAHAMEDCFVAAQKGVVEIQKGFIDRLLQGVDVLSPLAKVKMNEIHARIDQLLPTIESTIQGLTDALKGQPQQVPSAPAAPLPLPKQMPEASTPLQEKDRVLRVTAEHLSQLMGLAGETLVEARRLYPFCESLQKYRSRYRDIEENFERLKVHLGKVSLDEAAQANVLLLHGQMHQFYLDLSGQIAEFENFVGRHSTISDRLYQEVLESRMRPFSDGVESFPRMVRELAHQLGKQVKFEILGKSTQVDREVLEKLESPLNHLLRNGIDHGIETPDDRAAGGKPKEGVITLEAKHHAGMLEISVSDDGRGIDIELLRKKIEEKKLAQPDMVRNMTSDEIVEFLFLPGFSTSQKVSEISGRGVGLDVVQKMVQSLRGSIRVTFQPGKGTCFHLRLPVTLSVIRALLVEISGDIYGFPLSRIDHSFQLALDQLETIENRQFFHFEDQNIGLVAAWQILELEEASVGSKQLSVVVISDRLNSYGLVVDRFMGEKEMVVQELDARLGKVRDVMAGSVLEEGSPVLLLDVEDLARSIDNFLSGGRQSKLSPVTAIPASIPAKKILIVDDSPTVREVESRLLKNRGYEVDTAVNGMDGWNAIRGGHYDLIVTDLDMPRMNGLELLKNIKSDPQLHTLPVIMVSFQSNEEQRAKGLEAGAARYLTKSTFYDTTLIDAVVELIGEP